VSGLSSSKEAIASVIAKTKVVIPVKFINLPS